MCHLPASLIFQGRTQDFELIPFLSSPNVILHPLMPCVIRAWWTSCRPPRRGELLAASRNLSPAAGWMDASQMLFALVAYLLAGTVSPGLRPFLPGPLSPPLPLSYIPWPNTGFGFRLLSTHLAISRIILAQLQSNCTSIRFHMHMASDPLNQFSNWLF